MKNPIMEVKVKNKTILKLGLWEFLLHYIFLHSDAYTFNDLEMHLYLNGEEVEKPPEMEEGE